MSRAILGRTHRNVRIAVLGLSGVGKSTLIGNLSKHVSVLHLQASALIKAEQARRTEQQSSSEELRTGAVIDNQELLIAAFRREVEFATIPILLDGHSIIDGRDGVVEISSDVFYGLDLDFICYLVAPPEIIVERRKADISRERPTRDVETITEHQKMARLAAERIARDVACPFVLINDGDLEELLKLFA